MTEPSADAEARFEVLRTLGSGATGLVVEAVDHRTGSRVAVKRLRRDGPLDTAVLQREFRALADTLHPNLARLHGLVADADDLLLVMDVVDGRKLLHWVWDTVSPPPDAATSEGATWSTMSDARAPSAERSSVRPPVGPEHVARLRTVLRGLCTGLSALHAAGLLHRDVKPSNVMVREDGHVVLLDFGLASRPEAVDGVAGTVCYMAPEQLNGGPISAAADWYAVGAVIYEALAGRTPFVGAPGKVLFDKVVRDPTPLGELAPDGPADLVALATALLARDPLRRPDGGEICRAVGAEALGPPAPVAFVGREDELAALEAVAAGAGLRLVHVSGPSGNGKTRLVERFLQRLPPGTTVLAGRCYEREETPFKAVDPVVHALAAALSRRPGDLPDSANASVRMFPALARLPGLSAGPAHADAATEWALASAGLRALIGVLPAPVVWIDDLQWADLDSLHLLAQILAAPSPELLVVLSWRSDDPHMASLLRPLAHLGASEVRVEPLPEPDARALLAAELADDAVLERVLVEARGSPFLLGELARYAGVGNDPSGSLLHGALAARVTALDPASRAVLDEVAIAGRPVPRELVLAAARRFDPSAGSGELATLTVGRLVTTRRGVDLECVHDQVREAVVGLLAPDALRARHGAMAEALGPDADPEILAGHHEQSGELALAASCALRAAARAEAALAFERAVVLYRKALALGVPDAAAAEVALGRALASAGYGEAADVLLAASPRLSAAERATVEREAVHQLLRSGQWQRAYALLPSIVGAVGQRWPATRTGALAEVMLNTARMALPASLRGGRRTGSGRRTGPRDALELDLELAMSLSYADMLRSAVFSTRAILLAERTSDPAVIALAAAMRGSNACLLGDEAGAERWIEASRRQLPTEASARQRASVELHQGIVAATLARWGEAREVLGRVVTELERVGGLPYELGMGKVFLAFALVSSGELAAFRALRQSVITEARARGDRHLEVLFRVCFSLQPGLLDDDPDAAEANLREAAGIWEEGAGTVWLFTELARAQVDVYRGRPAEALARVTAAKGPAGRNGLLRITLNATLLHIVRASAAAPLAASDPAARAELRAAIQALSQVRSPTAPLQALTWAAAERAVLGDRAGAVVLADRALAGLEGVGMPWLSDLAEIQRRRFAGEDAGPAIARLGARGVAAPERLAALYAWAPV